MVSWHYKKHNQCKMRLLKEAYSMVIECNRDGKRTVISIELYGKQFQEG